MMNIVTCVCILLSFFIVTCRGADTWIDRDVENEFPKDCVPLTDDDIESAEWLLAASLTPESHSVSAESLQVMISKDKLKSYAWWRWAVLRMKKAEPALQVLLLGLKTLCLESSDPAKPLSSSIFSYYCLKDGTRIMHGPLLIYIFGKLSILGELRHGVRHGRWILYENGKKYADGEWKQGRPWNGNVEVFIGGDRCVTAYRDGKPINGPPSDGQIKIFSFPPISDPADRKK
jgi:hypothetical protein